MTSCGELSERMVLVARGGAAWTAAEAAHLAGCAECSAEWRVVEAGAMVGSRVAAVDAGRISARVRQRLADAESERGGVLRFPTRRWLAVGGLVAVAAALVLLVRRPTIERPPEAPPSALGVASLSELDELSAPELETVLGALEDTGEVPVTGLGDLTTEELERVLRSWES